MSKESKTVKKPHHLITARMNFSSREQNILMMLMSSVSKQLTDDYFLDDSKCNLNSNRLIFKYKVSEIAQEWGVTSRAILKLVDGENIVAVSARKLWDYDVYVKNSDGTFEAHRILQYMKFDSNNELTLHLTERFYQEMIDFKRKGFGKVELRTYYALKSPISQRLFEIATRFAGMGKIYETTIGEFCETIGVNFEQYSRPSSFTAVCLKRPIEQILKITGDDWAAVSKDGFTFTKRPEDKNKLTIHTKLKLDLRPSQVKISEEEELRQIKLVADYKAIKDLSFKVEDNDRLIQILDEIDSLERDTLDKLEIHKDAIFIKNWSILMAMK